MSAPTEDAAVLGEVRPAQTPGNAAVEWLITTSEDTGRS